MKYEYLVHNITFTSDVTEAMTRAIVGESLDNELRSRINKVVQDELNKLGSAGWLLHPNSGLTTLPTLLFYRSKK